MFSVHAYHLREVSGPGNLVRNLVAKMVPRLADYDICSNNHIVKLATNAIFLATKITKFSRLEVRKTL